MTRPGESGDTGWTPPAGHWHGATTGHVMRHSAMLDGGGNGTTWLEPVAGGHYQTADQP